MLLGCEPATVARASVILMVHGFGCMLLCCMLRAFMLHAILLQVEKECERLKVNLEQEKSARYSVVPNMVPRQSVVPNMVPRYSVVPNTVPRCTTAGAVPQHTLADCSLAWPPYHCLRRFAHAADAGRADE